MKIILRKMDSKFQWQDFGGVIEVRDNAHAMQIVYRHEDASGGRESFNYRVADSNEIAA